MGHTHVLSASYIRRHRVGGVASLRGKSIRERALELIRVAHPKFRAELLAEVRKSLLCTELSKHNAVEVPELGDVGFRGVKYRVAKHLIYGR